MGSGKFFAFLVGLSALCIAGSAAFFSVFGLSKLFAGATKEVIVMLRSVCCFSGLFFYDSMHCNELWLHSFQTLK